jgi:hypothetical protein
MGYREVMSIDKLRGELGTQLTRLARTLRARHRNTLLVVGLDCGPCMGLGIVEDHGVLCATWKMRKKGNQKDPTR